MLLLSLSLVFFVCPAGAFESTGMEIMLMDAINAGRSLEPVTSGGAERLDPLIVNERLCRSAREHTVNMLAGGYVSKIDLQGKKVQARLDADGYSALLIEETIGVVVFRNFMEPGRAVDILYNNMLETDAQILFNPALTHVGVGIQAGLLTLDGTTYNAYLATCDFSSPPSGVADAYELAEATLVHLVNQLRSQPAAVMSDAGIEIKSFLKKRPDIAEIMIRLDLDALVPNVRLFNAARRHTEEMAVFQYIDQYSNNGLSAGERIAEAGYQALAYSESIEMIAISDENSVEAVTRQIFRQILIRAVESDSISIPAILDPTATEIGIGLRLMRPGSGTAVKPLYIVTIDAAAPTTLQDIHLLGVVYEDQNNNDLFDAGEQVPGVPLFVDYPHRQLSRTTDFSGGVDLILGPGDTRIVVWPQVVDDEFWRIIEGGNSWFGKNIDTNLASWQ
ncbi:MAG: hypothetical protein CSA23_02875 [Deltaproteobacteria bacterium]|nr:MAG: hypothetical protein CSA23_02875 [Deltaproteobacteria bacterium]